MKIAILGFGTVGQGVAEILSKSQTSFTSQISISKILVKPDRASFYSDFIKNNQTLFSNKPTPSIVTKITDISDDSSISLVVECMGGISPSFEYVTECLKKSKKVVTSNKMLLASKYEELKNYFHLLKYEATVGGGIHIFHSINDIKKVDKIKSFKGIINGTTNYILSNMTENTNLDFETVLKESQKLGFAEADPSSDIDGIDAGYKAVLLFNEIFGYKKIIKIENVEIKGIRDIKKEDIINADKEGKVIKLIAYGDESKIYVKPICVDKSDYLAHIGKNLNCILVESENLGVSAYVGQGAGKLATAHAVVLDVVDFLK